MKQNISATSKKQTKTKQKQKHTHTTEDICFWYTLVCNILIYEWSHSINVLYGNLFQMKH